LSKKRIAVIGKGTAGSQSVIHFARFFPDTEIVWYFDPNRPAQSVGEGATLELPRNLYNNLGFFHEDLKKVNGTFKTGIYKENWGKKNDAFFHHFPPPQTSYHFSATELQDYIYLKMKDKVKIVEKDVDYSNVDASFILNASGKPKSYNDFVESQYIPVNSAYVTQCYWDYPRFDYTFTLARKHGWVFGIPLQNRFSVGYLYNNKFSQEEDLKEELEEIFEQYSLSPDPKTNSLSFNNYYRKINYENGGSIVHNGNASFFLEPLEATSIGTMDRIQRAAFDIWTGAITSTQANLAYSRLMSQLELIIMLHYAAGSKFDTEFWNFAQDRGIQKIKDMSSDKELKHMYQMIKNIDEMRFAPTDEIVPDYGQWWSGAFIQNLHGLGIHDTMEEMLRI